MINILIVDDKKENLYLLETLLKGSGYNVISAINGAEALEKLHAEGADMIISDILMPVMDGFQFCREVKNDDDLKNIPLVFYTATYTDGKDEELAIKVGADKFIRKPVEPDEFIRILQGVISDMEKGKLVPKKLAFADEKGFFKLYSERLVNKLEKKMLDLEKALTERKQAEEALKGSLGRWSSLVDNAPNLIAILDRHGVFQFVNRTIPGLTVEEVVGTKTYDYILPEYHDVVREKIEHVFDTGEVIYYELQGVGPHGETRWYETRVGPLIIDGQIVYVTQISSDITERRQAEEAIRESERFLQNVFNAIHDGISVLDPELNIIRVNSWIEKMYPDDMPYTGKKCYAVYQKRKSRCPWCPSVKSLKTGDTHSVVVPYPSEKKPRGWFDLSAYPLKDVEGHTIGVIEYVKDITERKKAEDALRGSEAQKTAILNGSIDRIRLVDKDMKVIWANKTTVKELNIAPGDIIGQFCYQAFVGRDRPCDKCPAKKALKTGKIEHTILNPHCAVE